MRCLHCKLQAIRSPSLWAPCRCLEHSEPALLVGETGIGKTTLCQMLAFMRGQRLHIINCNRNTEASEILGGFRPARRRQAAFEAVCKALKDAARCAMAGLLVG